MLAKMTKEGKRDKGKGGNRKSQSENSTVKTQTLEDSIGKAPGLTYAVSLKSPSVNITLRQLMGKSNIRFSFAGDRRRTIPPQPKGWGLSRKTDETLNFEISDLNGNDLSCQCTEADAVATILALLGFQGDELMLDTDDWRKYDWHTGKDTYTAREIVENDLDSTGNEVHFETYTDISSRVTSGAWIVKDDHAYCIAHWPSGKARRHIKRRCDFTQAAKLHPVWLDKLKQLESLGY